MACREAFGLNYMAAVSRINQYGGYNITGNRLAFVDGEQDPWRWAGPHAPHRGRPHVNSSLPEMPYLLIPGAGHHWDMNGVFRNETLPGIVPPDPVVDAKGEEVGFVLDWIKAWHRERASRAERLRPNA